MAAAVALVLQKEFPLHQPRGDPPLPSPVNDPIVSSIVERIRSVVARQPGRSLDALAKVLEVEAGAFRRLLEGPAEEIPDALVINVVSGFVREFGIGPEWLLTGNYDPATHRRAVVLGEDRSPAGRDALLVFVRERLAQVRKGGSPSP